MKMFYLILATFVCGTSSAATNSSEDISDYYWREYTGYVPSDALLAGNDKAGKPIYIGQGFFKEVGLLPATIYQGSKSITVTARGNIYTSNKNIKILCSRNPHKYQWIPTSNENMHLLTNCHLVVGGTETETILYVGRANHEMELRIGKVYPGFSPYKGLGIPHGGKEAHYDSFEVLAYNCNMKRICDNIEPNVY